MWCDLPFVVIVNFASSPRDRFAMVYVLCEGSLSLCWPDVVLCSYRVMLAALNFVGCVSGSMRWASCWMVLFVCGFKGPSVPVNVYDSRLSSLQKA